MAAAGGWRCVLAFDFGSRKIGVAVGQSTTGCASPLTTLPCLAGLPDWRAIEALVAEWQADILVVGLPRPADGGETALTRQVRSFASQLAGRTRRAVALVDERLSSAEARARLGQRRGRGKSASVDAVAASVILESWLESGGVRP